uniref:Uncharacterized protein n=1 Tax=Arundo donax TaxID=35708 RepID=A0A0A8YY03_ARUDO
MTNSANWENNHQKVRPTSQCTSPYSIDTCIRVLQH